MPNKRGITLMKFGLSRYTLDQFFENVIEKYAVNPSLALIGQKPLSYAEFGRRVQIMQDNFQKIGISKGDKVVILGPSSPNWAISFMAVTTMGAVAVPVLEGFPDSDIDHIVRHSEAAAIILSESLYQGLNLPALGQIQHIIKLDDLSLISSQDSGLAKIWKEIQELPEKLLKTLDKSRPDKNVIQIGEDDPAEILYTSGTTGHSKGVILTHKNLVSNLFEGPDLLKVIDENSVILSILPMAHAFGSTSAFLSIIYCGASIYYLNKPPSPKVLLDAMQTVRPTILGAVPLVFEKIYHKQVVPMITGKRLLRMFTKTRQTRKLLYKLIGKKINELLGGRLDCVIIGGASLSAEVETFMKEGGIPYCCGYGLSECSPLVTFSSMEKQKAGSPGHAITDVQIKIVDPDPQSGIGEICIKGPNVMKGYFKNKEATEKAFTRDGWFISGDQGYLDKEGYLFITGRSKNVIVGPSGENIYPEVIEARLSESIFVEECIVYLLDQQLVARIYPNYAYIESLASNHDENAVATDIEKILEGVRQETNAGLPAFSRIIKIIEQQSPFVKTPTNKIKRAEYVPGYVQPASC